METLSFLQQLGLFTGAQILILLVIGFFGKEMILYFFNNRIELKKAELSQSLEAYRSSLQSQTEIHRLELDKILESYRNDLALSTVKSSKLHERHLEIVAELFRLLSIMEQKFNLMTAALQFVVDDAEREELQRVEDAGAAFNEFSMFYSQRKIFFEKDLALALDELNQLYWTAHWDYTANKRFGIKDMMLQRENFDKAAKIVSEKIPKLQEELHAHFRHLLAVGNA